MLKAWEEGQTKQSEKGSGQKLGGERKKRLFAFFNSGDFSGASQGHRHLQFLPVEGMKDQAVEGSDLKGEFEFDWRPLIDLLGEADVAGDVPFQCFQACLEERMPTRQLVQTYLALYYKAVDAVKEYRQQQSVTKVEIPGTSTGTSSEISYNLAMTTNKMAICPRWDEGLEMKAASNGNDWKEGDTIGKVELNGTILAGTLMVKTAMEWNYLRRNEEGKPLEQLLSAIGIPGSHSGEGPFPSDERRGREHL